MVKNLPAMQETRVQSLDQEDPLEKVMAIHSTILAQRILWKEELGKLQSLGLQSVGHDWALIHLPFQVYDTDGITLVVIPCCLS